MKTTSRVLLCALVLGLGFILFAEVANAQNSKAGANAGNAANAGEMVTRVYPVADLVFTAPNFPFQGFTVPGTDGQSARKDPNDGAAAGMGGGFGGGGVGRALAVGAKVVAALAAGGAVSAWRRKENSMAMRATEAHFRWPTVELPPPRWRLRVNGCRKPYRFQSRRECGPAAAVPARLWRLAID